MKIAKLGDKPEIFHSLQGEGVSMGIPAVFLRLAFCNLRCEWCDTAYTWKWSPADKDRPVVKITPREVAEIIKTFPSRHVVITGGEPLLQDAKIVELAECLPLHTFEIETNGTLIPSDKLDSRAVQYNVSPKLAHSGNPAPLGINPEALKWYSRSPKAWFKFVIGEREDVDEVARLEQEHGLPHERILLMPRGTSTGEMDKVDGWLAQECLNRGYRLTDRLHIRLWGNKPGV